MRRQRAFVMSLFLVVLVGAGCGGGGNKSASNGQGSGSGSGAGSGAGSGSGTTSTTSGSSGGGGSGSGQINASITGHHSFREVLDHANPAGSVIETATLNWTLTFTGSVQGIKNGVAAPTLTSMTGEVTQTGSGVSSNVECAGSLSAAPNLSQGALEDLFSVYPPGDTNQTLAGNFGVGPTTNIGSSDYLLEGTIPGVAHPEDIVSADTNPADSGCNTGGLTYYYGQPQGSAEYTAWTQVLDPIADFTSAGQSTTGASHSFDWSGTVPNPPPGYTMTVTEQDSESFTFAPVG